MIQPLGVGDAVFIKDTDVNELHESRSSDLRVQKFHFTRTGALQVQAIIERGHDLAYA